MTSQDLLEEVKYPIQMANVIDDRLNLKNPVISGLFEPRQSESSGFQAVSQVLAPEGDHLQAIGRPSPLAAVGSQQPFSPFPAQVSPMLTQPLGNSYKRKALTEAEMAQERISTILSLNGTGGWIRDVEYNNFYFFYSDVVNKKPEELTSGMTLQFRLRFDKKKTEQKDNGEPSYRAIGPIYVVD